MLAVMIGSRRSAMRFAARQLRGIVDVLDGAVGALHLVDHGRRAGDQLQVVLALQSLLHDVHVQQAEEADAKTEAQRGRRLPARSAAPSR